MDMISRVSQRVVQIGLDRMRPGGVAEAAAPGMLLSPEAQHGAEHVQFGRSHGEAGGLDRAIWLQRGDHRIRRAEVNANQRRHGGPAAFLVTRRSISHVAPAAQCDQGHGRCRIVNRDGMEALGTLSAFG
jgi:hypothetical protein